MDSLVKQPWDPYKPFDPNDPKHPDPIFSPEELANIHSWILDGMIDTLDDFDDMTNDSKEEDADQAVRDLFILTSILRKIEKRIAVPPPGLHLADEALKKILGADYLTMDFDT